MASQRWLERLGAELDRQKLPPAYIERLVAELSDHWDDLMEETMLTETEREACLGQPEQLAEVARTAYGRGTLQRPLLAVVVFVLMPLPLLATVWIGLLWAIASAIDYVHVGAGLSPEQTFHPTAVRTCLTGLLIVSASIVMAFLGWLARRTGKSKRWAVASGATLAVVAGMTVQQVTLSDVSGQSSIAIGLGIGAYTMWQLCQFLMVLAAVIVILRRQTGTQGQPQTT